MILLNVFIADDEVNARDTGWAEVAVPVSTQQPIMRPFLYHLVLATSLTTVTQSL